MQRSEFQFEIIKLNLILNGGIVAFSINNEDAWRHALLACPIVSLILFSLWFHHALVILIDQGVSENSPSDYESPSFLQKARMWSFAVSMVANFVALPAAAVFVYSFKSVSVISYVSVATTILTALLFFTWFYLQYIRSGPIGKYE